MRDLFWIILAFPLAWPFIARAVFRTTITWQEAGLNLVLAVGLTWGMWQISIYSKSADTEILNGEVKSKKSAQVPCTHTYSCNCRMVSDADGKGQHEVCDTCHEHAYDVDWYLDTNLGRIYIARVDRRGIMTPWRWANAMIGDPVAKTHIYENLIQAASNSLFHEAAPLVDLYKGRLPDYPSNVYDYHYVDRVLADRVKLPEVAQWNRELALRLRQIGPQKQANVVIVFTAESDSNYAEALKARWLGGKKNDVVAVVGAPEFPKIAWTRVFSWSRDDMVNVSLRDRLMEAGDVDRKKFMDAISDEVSKHFDRRPMSEFEYLRSEIDPPLWGVILCFLIAVPGCLGLTWYFNRNEISLFGENNIFNRIGRRSLAGR